MRYKKYSIILVILVGIYVLYSFVFKQDTESALSFLTQTVERGVIARKVNATGQIRPMNLVDIGAQVSGQIEKLHVELGDGVKKGDLLVEIDSSTQRNNLETTKLQLASYEAQLQSRQISHNTLQAKFDREKKLRTQNATSKESFEDAENSLASAKAAVAEMKALIQQARLSVENAETDLGYTSIIAPRDGTVVAVLVEEGQTVNAIQTAPTLLQLVDLSSMELKIEISEGDITKVQSGMDVEFSILSEPTKKYKTSLASIDPAYTTMSNGAYAKTTNASEAVYYYANAIVENPDATLRIGMTVQNSIVVAKAENALKVISSAVKKKGDSYIVYIFKEDSPEKNRTKEHVVAQEVVIGISDGVHTEIVKGLQEGQEIITSHMDLKDMADIQMSKPRRIRF